TGSASPAGAPGDSETVTPNSNDFAPPGPDLSSREFVDLELDQLSTLKVDAAAPAAAPPIADSPSPSTPAPGIPTSPLPPPASTAAPSSAQTPTSQTPTSQTPTSQTPVSEASAVPSTSGTPALGADASTAAVTGGNYYVVTRFTGDASLAEARGVVSDAFVRNFRDGAYIQVAAFDNEASAQQQIKELQQRGLTLQLYGPTDE
ncbi:MAG: SPOR domain-containing protein, partial [Cyanobacteria bacterium P01_A01_bin.105]